MPQLATPKELDAIAYRIRRAPVFSAAGDCSQAFADRRVLLEHLMALEAAGQHVLGTLAIAPMELDGDALRLAEDW